MEKIYLEERLSKIVEIIRKNSKADVKELAERFKVTGATIRSDLNELEKRNLIIRTHGGAILKEMEGPDHKRFAKELSYRKRELLNESSKERIGREAVKLLSDGDNVMIDDGSTNLHVARNFPRDQKITVITNGLNICEALVGRPNVSIISAGGVLDQVDLSFQGSITKEITSSYYADKAIIGVSGLSMKMGITAASEAKAELKKIMINKSKELIVVADHSKLNRVSLISVCSVEQITTLVTDSKAPEQIVNAIRDAGVTVIIAS